MGNTLSDLFSDDSEIEEKRAYRNLAMDLILLCRFFVRAHEKSSNSFTQLRKVLIAADDVLRSAAEAGDKTSMDVDKKFEDVIDHLSAFEKDFPVSSKEYPKIGGTITWEAEMSDGSKSLSTVLCALKNNLHIGPMVNDCPKPTREVEFHIHSALLDASPRIVKQKLSSSPSLQEVLWNFCCFKDDSKRLTLGDNPHFYAEHPTSQDAYASSLKIDPTEDFLHGNKFYVLTDKSEPVHITTDQVSQFFGNFYCLKDAIIFKDMSGTLRGESIAKASLAGTYCGFCNQLPISTVARASTDRRGLQPIITEGCSWMGQCSTGRFPMHTSVDIGLRICTGRMTPDYPLLVPLPPTSEQAGYSVAYRTHIHMLDNDSLLQIFCHYRLEHGTDWNLLRMWQKLAHICKRWRYLVFDSSSESLLDMKFLLTNDSPPIDNLSYFPPLPLVIDYSDQTKTVTQKDDDNIHLGLQRHGLVRRVVLRAPSSSLDTWLKPMNKDFPRLRDLSLSTTTEDVSPVLPEALQAPDLRRLSLQGIGLSKGLPLLSSTAALSSLSLTDIRASCYFPPGHLATQLRGLPHLEELSIGFAIPIPLPSNERELLLAPIPPVTLPTLRRLTFRGVDIYIDNLVAQINTPLLEQLSLTLFYDLTFTLVNLAGFIHRTEGLGCLAARINFNKDGAFIDADHKKPGYYHSWDSRKLGLQVNCNPNWQMDAATQVCSALGMAVSTIEELTLNLDMDGMPSDWANTLDSMQWHELLRPFRGVKMLHIGSSETSLRVEISGVKMFDIGSSEYSLTVELSKALESDTRGLILPRLEELAVSLKVDDAANALAAFFDTRESMGRPVRLLVPPDNKEEMSRANLFQNTLSERRNRRERDLDRHSFEEAIAAERREKEMWKARALALEELLMELPVDISLSKASITRTVPSYT